MPGELPLSKHTRAWFDASFPGPTAVQSRGLPVIAAGGHALLAAPTGSGKTLAAFLHAIDGLMQPVSQDTAPPAPGVRVLYVSPLKALVHDIERNLRLPLAGIAAQAAAAGAHLHVPRVAVRTGDTSASERRAQLRDPAEILVTTPESLYLLLGSRAALHLHHVHTVILDEVHALVPGKRGAHLALSLERLAESAEVEPQRIGLSATAHPLSLVARYLGGDRPVSVVDAASPPRLSLSIEVPARDMTRPVPAPVPTDPQHGEPEAAAGQGSPTRDRGMWAVIVPRVLELIRSHRSTIVFVNSRGLCERLCRRINEVAGEDLARSHHGSLAHGERTVVEGQLKDGVLSAIIATSSLELGIDMEAVDLVVMVESPASVASGLQRVGRAGHGVGQVSEGLLLPKHRGDLLQATVVAQRMRAGTLESLTMPDNPLDVLAQQVVAMVAVRPWAVESLRSLVRRAANYAALPDSAFEGVLDMLSGRYPDHQFAGLRASLLWDRDTGELSPRRGARLAALMGGGTIPDRGTFPVYLANDGPRVGELDEEMVYESAPGEVFTLGASSFRVQEITQDRVIVSPAPGEPGRLPFWHGAGPGRPIELGRALGAFVREVSEMEAGQAGAYLQRTHGLDAMAADNLLAHLAEQREVTGTLPTDRAVTIERFLDELGDPRICILTPFGARVHAPWAMCIEAQLGAARGYEVQAVASDDGIMLRLSDADDQPPVSMLVPTPDEVESLLLPRLIQSSLFAGQFRENAARALLLPRRRPGARSPLWLQRRRAAELLAIARQFPAFPVVMETYRSCMRDLFDLPALASVLGAIAAGDLRVDAVDTARASPFTRGLSFEFTGNFMYDGDAPAPEQHAHALTLDRAQLRELLGETALRSLLDADVIAAVEAELQCTLPALRVTEVDGLHHLLSRLGDLSDTELAARSAAPASELLDPRRMLRVELGGQARTIAVEDAGLYRDALGVAPPEGVPVAFLGPVRSPLGALIGRYARTRGPFTAAAFAERFGMPPAQAETLLQVHVDSGALLIGEFLPGGSGQEYCDPGVLRRIRARTVAGLRAAIAPVDVAVFARFLPRWHGIDAPGRGIGHLAQVLEQLEGMPLSFAALEQHILPARVLDFRPAMLDELGATGRIVWVGHGGLTAGDGRVAIYRRTEVARLLPAPVRDAAGAAPEDGIDGADDGGTGRAIVAALGARGACFFAELVLAAGAPQQSVLAALQALCFSGVVTNDTFEPLRHIGGAARRAGGGARAMQRALARAAGGRWSLVAGLASAQLSDTERAHAGAALLLRRHGVVPREVAELEALPGGFQALRPVLRAMESEGRARRGYFVAGVGGVQYAHPGAVEQLRALSTSAPDNARSCVLSAVDPANPFGWLLPWPACADADAPRPRRVAGAVVVIVAGRPVCYLGKGLKQWLSFSPVAEPAALGAAVEALRGVAAGRRGRTLQLERIDGQPAGRAPLAAQLTAAGFVAGYRGLSLESTPR